LDEKFLIDNLLIGMTGSIGVISYSEFIFLLRKDIAKNINVIMSKNATKFITPFSIRVLSGNFVFTDTFDESEKIFVPHLELVRNSDLFLIMPATANIIGKLANGICDDLISTCAISAKIPVVVIPNMNSDMWFSKANQRNIALNKELGYHVLEPKVSTSQDTAVVDLFSKNENEISILSIAYEEIVEFIRELLITKKKQS
jgi:phosphopantothenoylcysteine decarboxylase/phosphopantothenate--cysteine ligase